jgi:hypothetical protein
MEGRGSQRPVGAVPFRSLTTDWLDMELQIKILHLTLKKQWFDLIASGTKKEEYREMKPYWHKRLNQHFDAICFKNGYSAASPKVTVELKEVLTGLGIIEWGAPERQHVYILRLGNILPVQRETVSDARAAADYMSVGGSDY